MNRRSFFKGLTAVFLAVIAPFKAKADNGQPYWGDYEKFLNTPHADRIDWEHLDPISPEFETGVLPRIKAAADASARLRLEVDGKIKPTYLLPAKVDLEPFWQSQCKDSITRYWGHQTEFADGRPWVPLKDDLRAALRAAMNNPVADTGAVQGTSDRV